MFRYMALPYLALRVVVICLCGVKSRRENIVSRKGLF